MSADTLSLLLTLVIVIYCSNFLHELGHAVMAWLSGLEVTAFGLGLGPPFLVVPWRGTRIYLGLKRPFQGFTWVLYPQLYPTRRAAVAMLAGGSLANLLAALVGGLCWYWLPWGERLFLVIMIINLIGVLNLIPFSVRLGKINTPSDGALILQTLWRGQASTPPPVSIQMVKSLEGFWPRIGDMRGQKVYLLLASLSWLALGNTEQAEALLARAEAMDANDSSLLRGLAALVRGCVTCATGEHEASAVALQDAEKAFTSFNSEGGLFLVALGRAELTLKKGNVADAEASLKTLPVQKLAASQPGPRVNLLATLLQVRAASQDKEELEQLRAEYERIRRRYSTPASDLGVYRTLADFYHQQGNLSQAEPAYSQALQAARKLYFQFADPVDRAHFRKCQEPLLHEAARCLKELGKEKEAAELGFFLPTPEEIAEQQAKIKERRNRAYLRAGRLLALVNFLLGLGMLVVLVIFFVPLDQWTALLAIFGFALFSVSFLGAFLDLLMYLLPRILPGIPPHGGLHLLLEMFPWLMLAVLLIILLGFLLPF